MKTAMDGLVAALDKAFGPNSLIELDQGGRIIPIDVLSTGIPSLDYATGVGGFPRGRIVEVFGPENTGKTTIIIKTMAETQKRLAKQGKVARCGFIDMEHAFDPSLARLHGANLSKGQGFHFSQPNTGQDALQMLEVMVDSNLFEIVAVDSVASLVTQAEYEGKIGDIHIASTAQLMSHTLKKLVGKINKSKTVVIFANQIRERPAVQYGSNETTSGGRALKFYASMRLRIANAGRISEGADPIGHHMKISVVKNKVAPPYQTTVVDLYYRDSVKKERKAGFDIFGDIITTAQAMGIIELTGSQYKYIDKSTGEVHKEQGLVKWRKYLEIKTDVADAIVAEIMGRDEMLGDGCDKEEQE